MIGIIPNPKYKDGHDEVIALYKSRKIENIRTAIKIAEKFAVVGKGEAGAAKSGTQLLKHYRGKQSATGKLETICQKAYQNIFCKRKHQSEVTIYFNQCKNQSTNIEPKSFY